MDCSLARPMPRPQRLPRTRCAPFLRRTSVGRHVFFSGSGSRGTLHLAVYAAKRRSRDKIFGAADVSFARVRCLTDEVGVCEFAHVPILRNSMKVGVLSGRIAKVGGVVDNHYRRHDKAPHILMRDLT
mmetsp:Transcript_16794/g.50940  ORF Transcript_16794/g.50940 Transcript_16794/m.50940 type:complete len:128 (+) Transcript_16794:2894-3277(+)